MGALPVLAVAGAGGVHRDWKSGDRRDRIVPVASSRPGFFSRRSPLKALLLAMALLTLVDMLLAGGPPRSAVSAPIPPAELLPRRRLEALKNLTGGRSYVDLDGWSWILATGSCVADPSNPLGLSPEEIAEGRRLLREVVDCGRRAEWAAVNLLDHFDPARLQVFDDQVADLAWMQVVSRRPVELGAREAAALLPTPVDLGDSARPPPGWSFAGEVDVRAERLGRRWDLDRRSGRSDWWGRGRSREEIFREVASPRYLLDAVSRVQRDPLLAWPPGEAARVAAWVVEVEEAWRDLVASWVELDRMVSEGRPPGVIPGRMRSMPGLDGIPPSTALDLMEGSLRGRSLVPLEADGAP